MNLPRIADWQALQAHILVCDLCGIDSSGGYEIGCEDGTELLDNMKECAA